MTDAGFLDEDVSKEFKNDSEELLRIIGSIQKTLKSKLKRKNIDQQN